MTTADRATRCLVGWAVTADRSIAVMQSVTDSNPHAVTAFSDACEGYVHLVYAGRRLVSAGKDDTYTVEVINADPRHYLARLAPRSRCFSSSLDALRTAITLFAYHFN